MAKRREDKELEQYRSLLETPTEFKDGFGWTTIAGIFFCGLVMMPGSIYLGLMTGGDMTSAATWVTVILFSEVARRALKPLNKQNLVVLLYAAQFMMTGYALMPGGPLGPLIYRAYFVGSDAVREQGMTNAFPSWWVPSGDSPAILERNLLHADWFIPIALVMFIMVISAIKKYTLGYFFFRLTSDIERLAFPLAPIAAQGAMALAEEQKSGGKTPAEVAVAAEGKEVELNAEGKPVPLFSRWRLFSLGACIGIIFGLVLVGIPAITGLVLEKPIFLIPQPFLDTTTLTEGFLPATPTGITIDLGILLVGMVIPFWAVVGTFIAVLLTFVLNPILYKTGILTTWQPGMDTVNTAFSNNVDFWLSFNIGSAVAIAIISIYSIARSLREKMQEAKREQNLTHEKQDIWATPEGRGDYPIWIALAAYTVASIILIVVCHKLIPQLPIAFLIIFSFVYAPLMSYVNARLLGISGQTVEIPFIREGAFILSQAKGVDIWLAPVPTENYGNLAQGFRVNELTGVSLRSLFKAEMVSIPVLFLCSLFFWSFIWKTNEVPSEFFPAAQIRWELMSKNQTLLYSSTFVPEGQEDVGMPFSETEFGKAVKIDVISASFAATMVMFILLSVFGLPIMLIYGFIRGVGDLPHTMILEIVGALLGRLYFQKKFGAKNFLRMAPTILAGYFTGVGLVAMATIAMNLIKQAVTGAPF